MKTWHIRGGGDVVEHYSVEAETEQEARDMFERGEAGQPWYTEVQGSYILNIDQED